MDASMYASMAVLLHICDLLKRCFGVLEEQMTEGHAIHFQKHGGPQIIGPACDEDGPSRTMTTCVNWVTCEKCKDWISKNTEYMRDWRR